MRTGRRASVKITENPLKCHRRTCSPVRTVGKHEEKAVLSLTNGTDGAHRLNAERINPLCTWRDFFFFFFSGFVKGGGVQALGTMHCGGAGESCQ